jgi:hypothetical protein
LLKKLSLLHCWRISSPHSDWVRGFVLNGGNLARRGR